MLAARSSRQIPVSLARRCISNTHPSPNFTYLRTSYYAPIQRQYSSVRGEYEIEGQKYVKDEWSNTPNTILAKVPRRLHLQQGHPISTLRALIESHFTGFSYLNSLSPIVTTKQNFDDLGFGPDHPGRNKTDTYYINEKTVLRTHTSAHEVDVFNAGERKWLLTADVYRRDEIDQSHYPVFHQMEGARVWGRTEQDMAGLAAENAKREKELKAADIIIEDD
ncbi:hypothetical protein RSAG8_00689, partial [Rhizoctonia solani AG-8 WAC10335]